MTRDIRREFRDRFVQARSYRSTEDDIGEDLMRAENYLSLVGFVMVVLGGIGVWSVTRVFVKQKIRSVAILKCVGATANQILATYVAQVLLLGVIGSLLGVGIAARCHRGDSCIGRRGFRQRVVRPDPVGGAAGPRRRPARVAAVLAGAAARGPASETAAAPALARHGRASRLQVRERGARRWCRHGCAVRTRCKSPPAAWSRRRSSRWPPGRQRPSRSRWSSVAALPGLRSCCMVPGRCWCAPSGRSPRRRIFRSATR